MRAADFLVLFATFFAVAIGWRAWLQWRRHGASGIALFRGSLADRLIGAAGGVLPALLLAQAALRAFSPELLASLRLPGAQHPALLPVGSALLLAGLLLIVAAQLQMGASWRVGIDRSARPGLVTGGLYRRSRNPIYLGLILALLSGVALLPTALSLLVLLAGAALIRAQVGREEVYLSQTYGDEFSTYAGRVPRFL